MLKLYQDYSREEVQKVFEPERVFTPQAGTWGLQGIVPIKDRPGDFVFFVSFGKRQGDYTFDESITTDGVLSWQSQPSQKFSNKQIAQFIGHDDALNSIYLFLRTDRGMKYTYLGKLKYLTHDRDREEPVHFQWQLLSGPPPGEVCSRVSLDLASAQFTTSNVSSGSQNVYELREIPFSEASALNVLTGVSTDTFKKNKKPNYAERDARNRELGLQGELLVLKHEKKFLLDAGRADLADLVIHTSVEEGDGAGFDILSYDLQGNKKFIEVKTTKCGSDADFFLTAHELAFAVRQEKNYFIYRLYNYDEQAHSADFYIVSGNPTSTWHLIPLLYRVKAKS